MLFLMEVLVIATNVICCHLLFFLLLSLSAIVIGYCLLSAIVVGCCLLLLLLLAVGLVAHYPFSLPSSGRRIYPVMGNYWVIFFITR